MIPCHSQKDNKSQNLLKRNMYQKHILNHIGMNDIFKVILHPWVKIKISLTQNDTMDRGAWIKIQKESNQEDSKGLKSRSIKSANWHGNEEQVDISVYHMLWSYGVQARKYPKIEVN